MLTHYRHYSPYYPVGTIFYILNAPHLKTLVFDAYSTGLVVQASTRISWFETNVYPELETLEIRIRQLVLDVIHTPKIVEALSQNIKYLRLLNATIGDVCSFPNLISLEIDLYSKTISQVKEESLDTSKEYDGVIHLEYFEAPKLTRIKVHAGLKQEVVPIGGSVPALRALEVQVITRMDIDSHTMEQLDELKLGGRIV